MRVELHRSLLTDPQSETLTLLAICSLGLLQRHRVIPDDPTVWNEWAKTLPTSLREEVQLAWELGQEAEALGPASAQIQVCKIDKCDLRGCPLVVNPSVAISLLGRPLRLLLENGRNDRAFLMAFADGATRAALENAERQGWLVFETAGGISEIRIRIESVLQQIDEPYTQLEVLRVLYLCDSDAKIAGKPSNEALAVQEALDRLHAVFHAHLGSSGSFGRVLRHRAAENYAPSVPVLKWAEQQFGYDAWELSREAASPMGRNKLIIATGNKGSARRRLLAAIALGELPNDTRSVLCMKEGRGEDHAPRTAPEVWATLDPFQAAALKDGFGASFSASFYGRASGLHDDSGEIIALLKNLLERL